MFTIVLVSLLSVVSAQSFCGKADNCVDSNFSELSQLPPAPISSTRYQQNDDTDLTISGPGKWELNKSKDLRENSFIRSTRRQMVCKTKELYGTTLVLKRARSIASLKRQSWLFRTKLSFIDSTAWAGMVFAYKGPNNHFRVAMRPVDGCVNLQKREEGRWVNLARGTLYKNLKTRQAYEVQVIYSDTTIHVTVVEGGSREMVANFLGAANRNDLREWHNLDVGLFSSAARKGVLFQKWVFVSATRISQIENKPIVNMRPAEPVPVPCAAGNTCTDTCTAGAWSAFGPCSAECDGGLQVRKRNIVLRPFEACELPRTEARDCNVGACGSEPELSKKQKEKFKDMLDTVEKKLAKAKTKRKRFAGEVTDLAPILLELQRKEAKFEDRETAFARLLNDAEDGTLTFRELRDILG